MARSIVGSSNFTQKMIQTLINTTDEQEHDLLYWLDLHFMFQLNISFPCTVFKMLQVDS